MAQSNSVPAAAAKEHLLAGEPLTRLEALVLYGLSNLPELVYEMRTQEQFKVVTKKVTYATAMVRINKHAVLKPPANLPIRDIFLTEYRVAK